MTERKIISKELLLQEYVNKPVSMREACLVLGCSPPTIIRLMAEYDLPPKARSWNPKRTNQYPQLQDRVWLEEQLKTKSAQQIAREIGTTSGNVSDFVKRYGLRDGTKSEAIQRGIEKAFPDGKIQDPEHYRPFHYFKIYKPDHPYASKHGYVLRHRLVAEEKLGRYILPGEIVHHKDHDPYNNHPDNLVVFATTAEHTKYHREERQAKANLRLQKKLRADQFRRDREALSVSWFPVDDCEICDEIMEDVRWSSEKMDALRQELAQIESEVDRLIVDNQLRMFEEDASTTLADKLPYLHHLDGNPENRDGANLALVDPRAHEPEPEEDLA